MTLKHQGRSVLTTANPLARFRVIKVAKKINQNGNNYKIRGKKWLLGVPKKRKL